METWNVEDNGKQPFRIGYTAMSSGIDNDDTNKQ